MLGFFMNKYLDGYTVLCEEERRSNPVIISYFWIASLRSQ
jgi:hypothetical protein